MKQAVHTRQLCYILLSAAILSCNNKQPAPSQALIEQLNLKSGDVIACGPPDAKFGSVHFDITGNEKTKKDFNLATELRSL